MNNITYADYIDLVEDMLNIDAEDAQKVGYVEEEFFNNFGFPLQEGYEFCFKLIDHIPVIEESTTKTLCKAFVSKKEHMILMSKEVKV